MTLAIAAKLLQKAASIDIRGAYLNAKMAGEMVLMELEPMLAQFLAKIAPEVIIFIDKKGNLHV
jgi:hypothetical protein